MASKNDENFIAFCDDLRAYVEEHHLFPDKHTRLSHKVKYTRKKIIRALQKTHRIRMADFCLERTLDYYEMVGALKKYKFLSELPKEEIEMGEVEITDYPLERPDQKKQI